ncbi:MAG: hypothetical protein IJR86_00630 [Bacteroidaceae bacterium]|nr:hypothetical protein [Bacteroidaceae bacterium]
MTTERRPLQNRPYDEVFSMIPNEELGTVMDALETDIYDWQDGTLKKYASQVRSDAAKEILTRHEVYLYHKEEGRDI